jgi:phage host-nuclease inhibitor protein Gam
MSKSRIKTPISAIRTRDEMETLVGQITALKTREQQVTGQMNEQITRLRRDYELTLGGIAVQIEEKTAIAKAWADSNAPEFGNRKSIAMTHGDVGWKIGNPALKTMSGWTWDRVLEHLKIRGWSRYIREKQEVNKEALIADRVGEYADNLKQVGVRVVQAETFFIEPRIVATETRLQEAA